VVESQLPPEAPQEVEVDGLSALDEAGGAEPDGGLPDSAPEPVPMLGQFLVEPDPELEPVLGVGFELEPVLVDEFEEAEPVFPEPVAPELVVPEPVVPVPVVPVFELHDDGEVVADEVAALATSAPPATRPEVSAPTANA
jgi:hypothetical protein